MDPYTAKAYAKDPLLLVSVLLAVAGAVQANTGLLSKIAEQYPTAFGLVMMGISVSTGALTAIKTYLVANPRPPAPTGRE